MPVIKVRTDNKVFVHVPGPHKPGQQVVFSDDLQKENAVAKVGTHSGFSTLLRELPNGVLLQYQATYEIYAQPPDPPSDAIAKGQIAAQGVVFWQDDFVENTKVAITGGTEAYLNARGEVTWNHVGGRALHTLHIKL